MFGAISFLQEQDWLSAEIIPRPIRECLTSNILLILRASDFQHYKSWGYNEEVTKLHLKHVPIYLEVLLLFTFVWCSLQRCLKIFNHYSFSSGCAVFCLVTQSCLTLWDPMNCSPPGSSLHGILQAKYWSGLPFPSPEDLPNPGIESRSPSFQVDSLPSEPTRKPKNIRVGCLFLLQGIFLTLESNLDLLHCRQILYQLRYQGNPSFLIRKCFYHQY